MKTIDVELVRKLLDYDPETGEFRWKPRDGIKQSWNTRYTTKVAGTTHSSGYIILKMPKPFGFWRAHRLAWLIIHGECPKELDHINGDRSDNRISNLRETTPVNNSVNKARHRNNTSGHVGVSFNKRKGKWHARVTFNGVEHSCGYHSTVEEAAAARTAMAIRIQGDARPIDPERGRYLHWRNRKVAQG